MVNQSSGPPRLVMPGCDRISELPDSLLTQILSYLPTKHSVMTSALSKRWKNLWLSVPSLDLNTWDFQHYGDHEVVLRFFDRLLAFDTASRLLNVKVKCCCFEIEGLRDRISTMIKRGPQHLHFESFSEHRERSGKHLYPFFDYVPLNLYTSKTLVSLKLKFSGLEDPGFVFMPCLKSMTLEQVHFRDDVSLERLVSGCPLLEELTLVRDMHSDFLGEDNSIMRVRSGSLKRFHVPLWHSNGRVKCTLEIDAPLLEHMTLGENYFDKIMVKNLNSLFMVDLNIKFFVKFGTSYPVDFSKTNEICYFLSGISSVRHMIISEKTVKALQLYSIVELMPFFVELMPKFNNLSRLEAVFHSSLEFLPTFLECFPNLKHLIMEIDYTWKMKDEFELTDVPQCFISTLACVQLKRIYRWRELEMKVATYFLENATVLKKLILSLTDNHRLVSDEEIFKEVNKVTKRSPTCQILCD